MCTANTSLSVVFKRAHKGNMLRKRKRSLEHKEIKKCGSYGSVIISQPPPLCVWKKTELYIKSHADTISDLAHQNIREACITTYLRNKIVDQAHGLCLPLQIKIENEKSGHFICQELPFLGYPLHEWMQYHSRQIEFYFPIFAYQIVYSLITLHSAGFGHNDLKPENLMIQDDPMMGYLAFVIDFGSCAVLFQDCSSNTSNITNRPLGTPNFSAPEVHHHRWNVEPHDFSFKNDVFSLGLVFLFYLQNNLEAPETVKLARDQYEQLLEYQTVKHRDQVAEIKSRRIFWPTCWKPSGRTSPLDFLRRTSNLDVLERKHNESVHTKLIEKMLLMDVRSRISLAEVGSYFLNFIMSKWNCTYGSWFRKVCPSLRDTKSPTPDRLHECFRRMYISYKRRFFQLYKHNPFPSYVPIHASYLISIPSTVQVLNEFIPYRKKLLDQISDSLRELKMTYLFLPIISIVDKYQIKTQQLSSKIKTSTELKMFSTVFIYLASILYTYFPNRKRNLLVCELISIPSVLELDSEALHILLDLSLHVLKVLEFDIIHFCLGTDSKSIPFDRLKKLAENPLFATFTHDELLTQYQEEISER